ncbi:hypothetical protein HPB47_018396 [Ixodes persulcatus]|uniref:Uncharacterized protein n=1 Tax=Ixodes persulcatus TaxID=34615 RepID=A0AC60QLN6_IXOPE|nr:hypothetical protein HPB47_018396 [Ixodes persulcatus]
MAWEIDQKLEAVCTDNARNICRGVEKTNFQSLECAAHTLQLCIHKALSDDSASKATVLRLTDVDWDMLEQLREAFTPLLGVRELLGGDKYVTRSVLIPAIKLLKNKMRINDCDPGFIYRFKAMLVDSIDERLSAWPHYNDYEMATCLDPRFKSLACIDKDRREHVWQELSQLAPTSNSKDKWMKDNYHCRRQGQTLRPPSRLPGSWSIFSPSDQNRAPGRYCHKATYLNK